jgi:hypothetical protein
MPPLNSDVTYVKTMSCSGSHLGITINIKNTKFVKDLPMIDAQFRIFVALLTFYNKEKRRKYHILKCQH